MVLRWGGACGRANSGGADSGEQRLDARGGFGKTLRGSIAAHVQALGVDEVHIGQTDETEESLEERHLRVESRVAVPAAARQRDIDALAGNQALRPVGAVAEGRAGLGHSIDPRLQLHRDAKVVHRHADHQHVRRLQLGDQRVVQCHAGGLFRRALFDRREDGAERRFVEHRVRRRSEVAQRHAGLRVFGTQPGDQVVGDAGGIAAFAAGAGVDLQNVHGGSPVGAQDHFARG